MGGPAQRSTMKSGYSKEQSIQPLEVIIRLSHARLYCRPSKLAAERCLPDIHPVPLVIVAVGLIKMASV